MMVANFSRSDQIFGNLSAQRNAAMDKLAIMSADLAMAREEIEELKKQIPPPIPAGEEGGDSKADRNSNGNGNGGMK